MKYTKIRLLLIITVISIVCLVWRGCKSTSKSDKIQEKDNTSSKIDSLIKAITIADSIHKSKYSILEKKCDVLIETVNTQKIVTVYLSNQVLSKASEKVCNIAIEQINVLDSMITINQRLSDKDSTIEYYKEKYEEEKSKNTYNMESQTSLRNLIPFHESGKSDERLIHNEEGLITNLACASLKISAQINSYEATPATLLMSKYLNEKNR